MSTSPRLAPAESPAGRPDRRRAARRSVVDELLVPVSLAGDNGGLVLDVSEAGLSVQAVGRLQSGTVTELRFHLPDTNARIHARGEVRWAEESGRAGIRILAFDEGSSNQIRMWMARSKPAVEVAPVSASADSAPATAGAVAVAPAPEVADIEEMEGKIAASGLDLDGALQWIAEQTLQAARATGTAIAIGTREEMVCRASFGAAPSLGVRLQAESGLSGECVRTGLLVRCDDTETDARVDAAVCRSLDLRAAVLVPVFAGEELRGVLEVFSDRPRAFGTADLHRFRTTSVLIAKVIAPPVAIPSSEVTASSVPAVAVAVEPPVETHPVLPTAVKPHPPAAVPVTRSRRVPTTVPTLHTLDDERVSSSAPKLGVAGAVLALLVGGAWFAIHRSASPVNAAAATAKVTPAQVSQSAPPVAQPSPEPVRTSVPKPEPKRSETSKAVAPKPSTLTANVAESAIRRPEQAGDEVAPPQLTAASTPIPNLALPGAAAPPTVVKRSGGVTPGRLISKVNPVYPPTAKRLGIKGDVVLSAIVREDGSVGTIEVKQGSPLLVRAAVDAVRRWRYEPYKLNGSPLEVAIEIKLHFAPAPTQ